MSGSRSIRGRACNWDALVKKGASGHGKIEGKCNHLNLPYDGKRKKLLYSGGVSALSELWYNRKAKAKLKL